MKFAGIYRLKDLLPRVGFRDNAFHVCFNVCHISGLPQAATQPHMQMRASATVPEIEVDLAVTCSHMSHNVCHGYIWCVYIYTHVFAGSSSLFAVEARRFGLLSALLV